MKQALIQYKQPLLICILIIFHTVGLFGMQSAQREYFLSLSPMNLLISVGCLLLSYNDFSFRRLFDMLVVGMAGYTVEYIGVHTGYLFGNYAYGPNLGVKVGEIPLMIGVNWIMLSFSTIACVMHLKAPVMLKALLSAMLMVGLDFLIEPVAVKSGYWSWAGGNIPLFNYVCWLVISFVLHIYLIKRKTPVRNKLAIALFSILVVFFGILNIL